MKQLPNILSISRGCLAAVLLAIPFPSAAFFALYALCGITDVLDGLLARRLDAQTAFGARLDSFCDLLFFAAALIRVLPYMQPDAIVTAGILTSAALRIIFAFTAKARFGRFAFMHTYANKVTGALLFLYPFTLIFFHSLVTAYIVCAAAVISAAEELLICLTCKKLQADRKSLFEK